MIRKTIPFLIVLSLLIGALSLEARPKKRKRYDCNTQVEKALQYYNERKHYNKVKTILNEVKMHCSGHPIMDTVLYFLGKSFLGSRQSSSARMEFEVLIQDFPKSPFYEEAHFLIGVCSLEEAHIYERDQVETKQAIREFNEFLETFPKSTFADSAKEYRQRCIDKLAKKEFMNARFYEKVDQYEAAITYYKLILENFPHSEYVPECKLGLARNMIKISRFKEANEILDALLADDKNDDIKVRAKLLKNRLEIQDKKVMPKKKQDAAINQQ